jgi:hypothetical protein
MNKPADSERLARALTLALDRVVRGQADGETWDAERVRDTFGIDLAVEVERALSKSRSRSPGPPLAEKG